MASKKTLNADNLEALGHARLAGLLIEVSEGNAAIKRRLRVELAGAESPATLVKEIRKRLATMARKVPRITAEIAQRAGCGQPS